MNVFDRIHAHRRRRFVAALEKRADIRKILVVRNGLMGDVVFITPVLERLRRTYPHAVLDVVVSNRASELLRETSGIGTVYTLPSDRHLTDHLKLFWMLRKNCYDLEVILEDDSHYTLLSLLTFPKWVATFSNALGMLANYTIPWPKGSHAVTAELQPVMEWTYNPPQNFRDTPMLSISPAEADEAAVTLLQADIRKEDFVICFHIGCSEPHSVRQWLPERYGELADILVDKHGAKILFTGTETDVPEIERIRQRMNSPSVSLAGRTSLRQLMAVLKRARIVVGPDTGALHIASALGSSTVMIMGYTDPADTRPFEDLRSRVARVDLPCSPCAPRDPKPLQWEICKKLRPALCMQTLLTQQVLAAIEELMDKPFMSVADRQ